jgi:hypothetical protein
MVEKSLNQVGSNANENLEVVYNWHYVGDNFFCNLVDDSTAAQILLGFSLN